MKSYPHFMRTCRNAVLLLGALLLSGCANLPAPSSTTPTHDALVVFTLEGRFSLRHEDKSYSGRLSWRHDGMNNELLLSSPLGQGMAEIVTSESGARLTGSDGRIYEASDAKTLTRQVLGYPLPLAQLTDWVRGRSAGARISERDVHGRPLRMHHEDWLIDFGYPSDDPQAPPDRIFAERAGGFELRLSIDEWNSASAGKREP